MHMNNKVINSLSLKIIAIITMTIDHIGAVLLNNLLIFRIIGRLSFPIFAFLIVEGFIHTKSFKKYIFRLFVFSLISQIPYMLCFNINIKNFELNVFFTLIAGLLALWAIKNLNPLKSVTIVVVLTVITELLRCDWGGIGILVIVGFYLCKNNKRLMFFIIPFIYIIYLFYESYYLNTPISNIYLSIKLYGLLSLPMLYYYNGQKGKFKFKYFFYAYYPVHLFIIYLIKLI
jgi:hypothetical protein